MPSQKLAPAVEFDVFANIIDGNAVKSQQTRRGINPSTGEELFEVPLATEADVDQAVKAARHAFPSWSKMPIDQRKALLRNYAEHIGQHTDELTKLLHDEQGKPSNWARLEIQSTVKYILDIITQDLPDTVVQDDDDKLIETRCTPLGVVCGIVPWNFPVKIAIAKIAPALMTGSCCIIKPSPFTPYCGIKIVELAQSIFPSGVLQVLSGDNSLGPILTAHPGIDKISFTGSTATGKKLMESASKTLKKVTLELGGNDPAIILPDVDVSKVAPQIANFAFLNSGQVCIAIKRVYVHEDIYEQFRNAMVTYTKTLGVKEGVSENFWIGPVQNSMQYDRVQGILSDTKEKGYSIALGGEPSSEPQGYFINPVIVDRPPDDSRLVVEEPFGPIVPLLVWSKEDEMLARANATDMGLGASVWGKDIDRARRIAHQIEAGTVWINEHMALNAHTAFAGQKSSGIGVESGPLGLLEYCNLQSVVLKKKADV